MCIRDRLVSGGVVGEKLMGRGVLAICVVSSLTGGLLAVRRLERGTLLAGLGVGVILFLLLLTAGFLLYEEASLSNGGVPIQMCIRDSHQGDKPLAYHAGSADDTYFILFHSILPPQQHRVFYVPRVR